MTTSKQLLENLRFLRPEAKFKFAKDQFLMVGKIMREAADEIERLTKLSEECGLECSAGFRKFAAENKRLRAWQSRATQVLPLIDRHADPELQEFVSKLLRNEVPPSTGAPDFDRPAVETAPASKAASIGVDDPEFGLFAGTSAAKEIERLRALVKEAIYGHKMWEGIYGSSPESRRHLERLNEGLQGSSVETLPAPKTASIDALIIACREGANPVCVALCDEIKRLHGDLRVIHESHKWLFNEKKRLEGALERCRGLPEHWIGLDGEDGEPYDPNYMRRPAVETESPLRLPGKDGWTLDTRLIRAIFDEIRGDDFAPSEEGIELVLLAFEKVTARRLADYGAPEKARECPVHTQPGHPFADCTCAKQERTDD